MDGIAASPLRLLVVLALILACVPVRGADLENAEAAYQRADYKTAIGLWRPLADGGDAVAQFYMGTVYFHGHGVGADQTLATRWYRRAAEQGYGPAQFNLGNAYKHGRGVAADEAQAVLWWRRAADQDYAVAQYNLALQYHFGLGVAEDQEQALHWLRRAADNGHAKAQTVVASMDAEPIQVESEDWVLAQDPKAYTVQLLATADATRIVPALTRHGYSGRVAAFRFARKGETWFGVIHGVFSGRAAARKAIEDLPAGLRAGGPWVRRMSDVQTLLGRIVSR